jgi:sarcosine oxidase, subunit beta
VALPRSAEAVVVGGGVIGASVAFHLAEAEVEGVVLVERGEIASGSSGAGAGGVRAQFSDPLNVELGRRSLEAFAGFGERPGGDIGLERPGYLFVLTREEDVAEFEHSAALQNALGVPTVMLTAPAAAKHCPVLMTDDVLAASFCPWEGYARPRSVALEYARAARRLGAHVASGCELLALESDRGEIRAAVTSGGTIATRVVVCAAGAWSRGIGRLAGVDLPVTPYPRQIVHTASAPERGDGLPFTIDFATFFYFRPYDDGVLMGMREATEPSFDAPSDPGFRDRLLAVARRRAPALAELPIAGGWGGLYESTPDDNALIGEAAGPSRFLYATGFSGHGFLQAPATGEIVRDLFLGRAPFVDVAPLSAERFGAGDGRAERNIV